MPTVHPRGDQRILRCTQSLLDAGFRIHLLWLGGDRGSDHWSGWLSETRLPEASGTTDRLRALPYLSALAGRRRPDAWHVHDYYMLPFALLWRAVSHRPVIYDVHEFYGLLYAAKMPSLLRRPAAYLIDAFQGWAAERLGGVNLVAEAMRHTFARCPEARTAVTPNFPARESLDEFDSVATGHVPVDVIHIGSLSPSYGSHVLIEIARLLAERSSSTRLIVVRRFPSSEARRAFLAAVDAAGSPPNLVMVDPVPMHQVPALLAPCAIGLSLIQDGGQNRLATPTKLFEYALAGLVVVGSDLPEQREFVIRHGVGQLVDPADAAGYVRAIEEVQRNWSELKQQARSKASEARELMSWEATCSPRLQALARAVVT